MKFFSCLFFALLLVKVGQSQNRFYADKSTITFFSDGVIEDIKAKNTTVTSILDMDKREIAFLVKIKDFQFDKKLMQVHFNEKYLESEKFPKSSFIGQVTGFNPEKNGLQQVVAVGKLFIHGVTKEVKIPGTIEKNGQILKLRSKFMVRLEDYNITIPQIIWNNVAEAVEVDLNLNYIPL
jgi:hypothetical protein